MAPVSGLDQSGSALLACALQREWQERGLKKRSRVDLGGSPMPLMPEPHPGARATSPGGGARPGCSESSVEGCCKR